MNLTITNYQPLFLPLTAFIIGILLQTKIQANSSVLAFTIILELIILIKMKKQLPQINEKHLLFHVLYIFATSGALIYQYQQNNFLTKTEKIRNCNRFTAEVISKDFIINSNYKQKTVLRILEDSTGECKNFKIVYYSKNKNFLQIGDIVKIKNVKPQIPKQKGKTPNRPPSFFEYLIRENIQATLFPSKAMKIQIIQRPTISITRAIWNKRNTIFQNLQHKLPPRAFCFFSSIFLGNKNVPLITEIKEEFNRWGVSHYLARSGLHISSIISIWKILLNNIPINFIFKSTFLILVILLYTILSWGSLSFYRSLLIFLLLEIGLILKKQTSPLHIFLLITFLTLCHNPILLFFLDFQLSFGITAILFLTNFANKQQI